MTAAHAAGRGPLWPLGAFYALFFAAVGAMLPFWSLYLDERGFAPAQIGALMGVLMAMKIVGPNAWGWLADRRGRRLGIVRGALVGALAAFALVPVAEGAWALAAVLALYGLFWTGALPQFEAVTLGRLGAEAHRYGRIRAWGSIGFIAAVLAMGAATERAGAGIVPGVVIAIMAALACASLLAREAPAGPAARDAEPLGRLVARPAVLALLAACFLMQASHGPFYAFFSIHMEAHGWGRGAIGALWALGVGAEVAIFLVMPRIVARFGLRAPFLWAFALTAARWALVAAFPSIAAVIVLTQLLHAASFGVYHAAAIQLVARHFGETHRGTGQALYSSAGFGAGGAAGALLAGLGWESVGPGATWLGAAAASAAAFAVAWRWLREDVEAAPRAALPGRLEGSGAS